MITVICGMIGSGKTTFCKKNNYIYTDWDIIKDKRKQIIETLKYDRQNIDVYHITTYPSIKERNAFKGLDVKYIWINTSFNQCKENIIKRNRTRDMIDLEQTLNSNKEILNNYLYGGFVFDGVINVFKSNEKW